MSSTIRLKFYSTTIRAIGIVGLGILAILLSQCSSADVEPSASSPANTPSPVTQVDPVSPPTPVPSASVTPSVTLDVTPSPAQPNQAGQLRVSNPTNHSVRVVLLSQQAIAPTTNKALPAEPVHWDFAPQEGSAKGLLLSLPNGNLQLQTGDVLVAFAEDGSRRYWGPYILGKTPTPVWAENEWLLILQP